MVGASDAVLGLTEWDPRVTRLEPRGKVMDVYTPFVDSADVPMLESERTYDGEPFYRALSFNADPLHFYIVLYASVFLVFPGLAVRRRLLSLGAGMSALFAFHVIALLVFVEYVYAMLFQGFSQPHYTPGEQAFYEWLQDTAIDFAVQMIPAIPLALLVVTSGGFGRPLLALPGGASAGASTPRRPRPRARLLAAGAGGLVVVAPLAFLFTWKVPARQTEAFTARGDRIVSRRESTHEDLARARALYESALARLPRHVGARMGLALSHGRQRHFEQAAEEFLRVLELDGRRWEARMHLGNTLLAMNRPEEAAGHYLMLLDEPGFHADPRSCTQLTHLRRALSSGLSASTGSRLAAKVGPVETRCQARAGTRIEGAPAR